MPESSHAAHLFKSLVEREGPTTLDVYARIILENVKALHAIRDRLEQEKDVKTFNVIQQASTFGPWLDVRSNLPSQLNFRFPEQHAVTLAYGEMREHALTVETARSTLTKPVTNFFLLQLQVGRMKTTSPPTIPSRLMAIYHNLDSVVMVIFLGDQNQLPPTVLSHHRKLNEADRDSLPYNIFTPQLAMSLMARQIENGMRYTMFTKQYRMTAGIEELSSRMCYGGRLENDRSTLLVNRQPSQDAIDFIQNQFGLTTTIPHIFLNVHKGVCIKGRTMSRHNPPNVIMVMFVIESVLEAGLFRGDEICVIAPYREQVSRIRTAIAKASANNESLRNRGFLSVRVSTIDSMQGGEANMVIVDLVLAKRRKGRYGFFTNRGRINVGVTRARFFQVLIGDCNAIDAAKAKEAKDQDQVPDTVVSDEEDEAFVKDVGPWESSLKHIRLLYQHYQEKGVVVDMDYEDKPQSVYVDLTAAKAFLEEFDASR